MSLLFNMLFRLVITFLPGSKRLLISWLQSQSAMILESKKINSVTVSTFSPPNHHEVMPWSSVQFTSVTQSCPTLCNHGLQHARPPCPSPTPGVYLNSCPLSWWCHPTISSSVIPFSSHLQSFPASGSFQMNQLFASGGQRVGNFSFSISPSNEYSGLISFRMDW